MMDSVIETRVLGGADKIQRGTNRISSVRRTPNLSRTYTNEDRSTVFINEIASHDGSAVCCVRMWNRGVWAVEKLVVSRVFV